MAARRSAARVCLGLPIKSNDEREKIFNVNNRKIHGHLHADFYRQSRFVINFLLCIVQSCKPYEYCQSQKIKNPCLLLLPNLPVPATGVHPCCSRSANLLRSSSTHSN